MSRLLPLLIVLLAARPAAAQDPLPDPSPAPTPAAARSSTAQDPALSKSLGGLEVSFERMRVWPEGDLTGILFSGNVTATMKDLELRSDRLLLYVREKPAAGQAPVRDIFAEGNVSYRRYDPDLKKWNVFSVATFYYDLDNRRAWLLDVATQHHFAKRKNEKELKSDIAVRAREIRMLEIGKLEAEGVSISTCTYGDPHYTLNFRKAKIDLGKPVDDDPMKLSFGDKPDWDFKGEGFSVDLWGMPVFFWPVIAVGAAAARTFPIKKLSGGDSNRFGLHAKSLWGINLRKGAIDSAWPWADANAEDDRDKWGELNWVIDWRQERGWAFGLVPEWRWGGYHGYVNSYGMDDKGPNPDNDFDQKFLPLEEERRARFRFFHRAALSDVLRVDLEYSWLSDRNLLEEFFEEEFKEQKEQETALYLRMIEGSYGGYLYQRNRINDFQTQVEFLPKTRFYMFDLPVIGGRVAGITYTQEAEVAHLRQRQDEAVGGAEPRTWRADSLNTLVGALRAGVVTVSPFAEARATWVRDDLEGEPETRLLGTAGVRARSEWSRVYDASWEAVGLRRLRHLASFEVRAAATMVNTVDPAEFVPYDATDPRGEFAEIVLETRHRFQTRAPDGKGGSAVVEFLEAGLQAEYYPRHRRDTGRELVDNYEAPFHWISLKPHDSTGAIAERTWSNLHWDVQFRPAKFLSGSARGEYNPVHKQEEKREFTVTWAPAPKTSFTLGQVFLINVTNAITVQAQWQVTEKWRVNAGVQYDYEAEEFIGRRLTVTRDLHDFLLEVIFEEDVGRDEKKFYVTFVPTFLKLQR